MNIISQLVLKRQVDLLKQLLESDIDMDINESKNGVTPLWCAITGEATKKKEICGKGDIKIVELLLKKGADPNKKCILTSPVYISIFEKQYHMLILLLLHGASPNEFTLVKVEKGVNNLSYCRCMMPIVLAIDHGYEECVRILLYYGAYYSKETIQRAIDQRKETKNFIDNYDKLYNSIYSKRDQLEKLKNQKNIIKLLQDNYKEEFEQQVDTYIEQHKKTGSYLNSFIGFRELKPV